LPVKAGKALAVIAILLWSLFPIAFIVMSSLKPGQDIFAVPPKYLFTPTFEHYVSLWTRWGVFFSGLLNSTIITAGATAIAIVASTCAGYVYSRNSGRFLNASVLFLIIVRLIPPIVVTLPLLGPAIVVALLFRYIFAFRMFSEVWLLTQGGPARTTEVVAVYLYQEAFTFNAFGTASATAWIMVVASLLLATGYVFILRKQVNANAH
jgi:ABC-type sugar transport system permease subunit